MADSGYFAVTLDQSIGNLNKQRIDIRTGTRDFCGFNLAAALVVAGTASGP